MGQPIPPGDSPLIEGLDSSWNDIVQYIPEDKRSEFAPKLSSKVSEYNTKLEGYKQWDDLHKSGVTADQAGTALNLYSIIENNPRQVYDTIGKALGISPQEAKAAVEEIQQEQTPQEEDPRLTKLQQQYEMLAQIMLGQHEQSTKAQQQQEADNALKQEIEAARAKHGDFDEEQVTMMMLYGNLTAEQAVAKYNSMVEGIRARRPAPQLLGSGGHVPNSRAIDPVKLSEPDTRNVVAQMLRAANDARRA